MMVIWLKGNVFYDGDDYDCDGEDGDGQDDVGEAVGDGDGQDGEGEADRLKAVLGAVRQRLRLQLHREAGAGKEEGLKKY